MVVSKWPKRGPLWRGNEASLSSSEGETWTIVISKMAFKSVIYQITPEMHCFCDDGSKVYSWLETAIMEEKLVLFLDTWSYTTSLSATIETGNWRRHISVTLKLFSCIVKHKQTNKHAAVLHVHQRRKKRQCGMHLWVGPETASSL